MALKRIKHGLLFLLIPTGCLAQSITALTNHVQYKNGDKYVHPSIPYAATGFLVEHNGEVFAITAKHVLWVARNKKSNNVEVNAELHRWIMKTKPGTVDSVIVDKLVNEDGFEVLEGPGSTILERDALVLSVKYASPNIRRFKIRYSDVAPGEKVSITGNPYPEPVTKTIETKIVRKLGYDILFEQPPDAVIAGFSGSPIIDANGYLVGIFSSVSTDAKTGKNVIVGTSTEYLKKIFDKEKDINKPREDYGKLILDLVLKKGTSKAIAYYKELAGNPSNYYKYNLRSSTSNGLRESGEKLIEMNRLTDAIKILEFNTEENSIYFHNYNVLAKAYVRAGQKEKAIESYKKSISLLNSPEENDAFKELTKLEEK